MLPRSHNIVGRWCPSAGATGFRLFDRVGSNHGTLTNMDAASDWVPSGGKLALDFDKSNDRVVVDNSRLLNPSLGISLTAWFLVTSTSAGVQQAIMRKGWITGTNLQYSMRVLGDKLSGFVVNTSGTLAVATGATSLSTNRWYFGTVTYDRINVKTYLNGALDATTALSGSIASFSESLQIGAGLDSTSNTPSIFFGGQLDDLIIYNAALTENEVREVYRLGRGYGVYPDFDFDDANIIAPAFRPYWASRRSQLIGGGI